MTEITCEKVFYSGQFAEIVRLYEASKLPDVQGSLLVGAYVFSGELEKAEKIFAQFKLQKNAEALFFLSLGYVRSSQYDKAKKILATLLNMKSKKNNLFFIQQGYGFYRYFCGRYSKALLWAQLAQRNSKSPFQKLINFDLLSHILVHLGKIQKGLLYAERALMHAKQLKNTSAIDAIQVGTAVYHSQFSLKTQETLNELLNLKKRFQTKNTYYYMNLTLEYVRRLNLEGEIKNSEKELDAIKKDIFESSLDRQKATWCFRQAHIFYLKRQPQLSLDMTTSALDYVDQNIDLYLSVQILGLKYKILKQQKASESEISELEERIKKITFRSQDATALSYAYRYGWLKKPITEDPYASFFHQWIREGHKNYTLIKKVSEKKWVSLFVDLVSIQNKNFVYLDVLPKHLMIFGSDQFVLKQGLTPLIRQTLLVLTKSSYSKQEFVEMIWGYQYDSYRHDPLIYTLLNRIRELLDPLSENLIVSDNKIRLQDTEVRVYEHLQFPKISETVVSRMPETEALNRRQLEILEYLSHNKYVSVTQTSEFLHVSKITACRDLTALFLEKKIRRIGKGRATSYVLN
jgi:hypothetical protein